LDITALVLPTVTRHKRVTQGSQD